MRLLNGPIKSRDCSLDTYRTISRPLRLKRIHTRRMRFAATIRAFAILHTVRCKSGGKSANASYRPPHIGDAPVRGLTRRSLIFSHMHCIRTMGAILATLVGTPRLSLPSSLLLTPHPQGPTPNRTGFQVDLLVQKSLLGPGA